MNNFDKWFMKLTQKIKNIPVNGTLIIHQFEKSTEEDRGKAELMLNDFAKSLGRPDVKIVAKNNIMN